MTVKTLQNGQFAVQRPGRPVHFVSVTPEGKQCDCQGYRYRRRCAHVDAIRGAGVSEQPQRKPRTPSPTPAATFNVAGIPSELRSRVAWVGWRPSKVPVNVRTDCNASCNDPSTWNTFEQALEWAEETGCGIGYEFTASDPYTGIDLDGVRDPDTGTIEPWAQDVIDSLNSYAEVSPSGRGVHVLIRGTVPGARCRAGSVEMYSKARYFCVTGRRVPGTPSSIEQRQDALNDLYEQTFGGKA